MKYLVQLINHRGESRIAVTFDNTPQLVARFKQIKGAKWSQTLRVWHLPDTPEYRQLFRLTQQAEEPSRPQEKEVQQSHKIPFNIEQIDVSSIENEKLKKVHQFRLWLKSRRYSENTIRTYIEVTRLFLYFFPTKQVEEIDNDDIITFNNRYILERQLSSSYQNQFVNAIKLFFQVVEGTSLNIDDIHRPKAPKDLPTILSKTEVKKILEAPVNIKHRMMLSLIYACGLRSGELINLKPSDILSDRLLLHIRNSKGKKDRVIPISLKTLELLRSYFKAYRPKVWLFEGQFAGERYSRRSLQQVLKSAIKKAGIQKPVTLHWLRHSYATHLMDSGTDLRYIQELLGHSSSRTTEIYTHVSTRSLQNIRSPFDEL